MFRMDENDPTSGKGGSESKKNSPQKHKTSVYFRLYFFSSAITDTFTVVLWWDFSFPSFQGLFVCFVFKHRNSTHDGS